MIIFPSIFNLFDRNLETTRTYSNPLFSTGIPQRTSRSLNTSSPLRPSTNASNESIFNLPTSNQQTSQVDPEAEVEEDAEADAEPTNEQQNETSMKRRYAATVTVLLLMAFLNIYVIK